jgi:L-lysine cyclodeaminase
MTNSTTIITSTHIAEICDEISIDFLMDETIRQLELALQHYDDNNVLVKKRDGYFYTSPVYGMIEWMPVYIQNQGIATKLVGYHPHNPDQKIATIQAVICELDIKTGRLLTLCEGNFATAIRTGAASAIASKYLSYPSSSVLGLIGCGAQAVTQLHAISRVRHIERVLIYDTDKNAQAEFLQKTSVFTRANVIDATLDEIEKESDIICTATSVSVGGGPVFEGYKTRRHVHVNGVGADFKGKFEIPHHLLEQSYVCPDFLPQALEEGECQQLVQDQIGDSLDIVVKSPNDYKRYQNGRTVFDSTGFALEDYVIMKIIKDLAKKFEKGLQVKLDDNFDLPKDPYYFLQRYKKVVI